MPYGRASFLAPQPRRPPRDPPRHALHAFGELTRRRQQADHQVLAIGEVEEEAWLDNDVVFHQQLVGKLLIVLALG